MCIRDRLEAVVDVTIGSKFRLNGKVQPAIFAANWGYFRDICPLSISTDQKVTEFPREVRPKQESPVATHKVRALGSTADPRSMPSGLAPGEKMVPRCARSNRLPPKFVGLALSRAITARDWLLPTSCLNKQASGV